MYFHFEILVIMVIRIFKRCSNQTYFCLNFNFLTEHIHTNDSNGKCKYLNTLGYLAITKSIKLNNV